MKDAILDFPKQFEFEPDIKNGEKLGKHDRFVVCGMGGSNLVAGLYKTWRPEIDILIHKDYGLPSVSLDSRLVIVISYSGNTEEALSSFDEAVSKKLPVIAIGTGGKLIQKAKEHGIPHIILPDTGIQPRMATGFSFKALLKAMGRDDDLKDIWKLATALEPKEIETEGKVVAKKLKKKVPVIYASTRNEAIAYLWKIVFNETGKIPAFYNVFPELNHNEMNSFAFKKLAKYFHFIFIRDEQDHSHIKKRAEVLEKLYGDRGLSVAIIDMRGTWVPERIFSSLLLAAWSGYHVAQMYGLDPETVPMVEEFKGLIAENEK